MELTVACVLRSGGDFTVDYVVRMRDAIAERLPQARFVCLSDVKVPCERIRLERGMRGWWSKIELFRAGLFSGRVLYFDLDTMFVGALDDIAAYPHRFTAGYDWLIPGGLNSGFMAWEGDYSHLYNEFEPKHLTEYAREMRRWGDQAYIGEHVGRPVESTHLLFPGQFVSFKRHCKHGVPADARVVLFHGKPRPADIGWRLNRAA